MLPEAVGNAISTLRTDMTAHLRSRAQRRIREVDGLRGVALTLVVIFHLFGHGRVSGGVDVFLTVSGFLLALSLGRAVRDGRPLGIARRWGRTFARLAPPATIVLVAVVVLAYTALPPLHRQQTLAEAASAALYLENWQLIVSQLAYGAAGPDASPLQHFWSLSVQGQFFLVFPLVVAVLILVVPRRARLAAFWTLIAVATAVSFVYAWHRNLLNPPAAYFDSFARFWELGAGALLAWFVLHGRLLPAALRPYTGWLGLALIVGSGFVVDGVSAYPGPAALLPVGGAALVILSSGSESRASASAVLSRPMFALVDRYSYGLYLWHWPLLITYLAWTGRDAVNPAEGAAVLAVSVVAAVLTRFALLPIGARTQTSARAASIVVAASVVLAVAVPAGGLAAAQLRASESTVADGCLGAAAMDPDLPECADDEWEGDPVPAADRLAADDAFYPECWTGYDDRTPNRCSFGPEEHTLHLLAVGDSHLSHYNDVWRDIAERNGWRIDVMARASCTWTHAEQHQNTPAGFRDCDRWNRAVDRYVASAELDGIIVSQSSTKPYQVPDGADPIDYRVDGFVSAWAAATDEGVPVFVVRDNPVFPLEFTECAYERNSTETCSVRRTQALEEDAAAEAVSEVDEAHLIDLSDFFCDRECPAVIGGAVVARDAGHLTRTFARTLTPYIERELLAVLADRR